MHTLKGPGTLTFADGRSFPVSVDVEIPGKGKITAGEMIRISERHQPAVLSCSGVKVEALVTDGHPNGTGHVVISEDAYTRIVGITEISPI